MRQREAAKVKQGQRARVRGTPNWRGIELIDRGTPQGVPLRDGKKRPCFLLTSSVCRFGPRYRDVHPDDWHSYQVVETFAQFRAKGKVKRGRAAC